MESPPAPTTPSRTSANLVEFFLLQFGCGLLFLLPLWLGQLGAILCFFLGAYLMLEDVFTRLDGYSERQLSAGWRVLLLRLASFLIGSFYGGLLSLAFVVGLGVTGVGHGLPAAVQLAPLLCLVPAVIAGSLVFVGRRLHRFGRQLCFWRK